MKKTLIIFIIILIGFAVIGSVISIKSQYNAEKRLWKINRLFAESSQTPEAVPEQIFDKLAKDYRRFVVDFPDSVLRPQALILLGRVFLLKKDYATAREELENIIKEYPDDRNLQAEARSVIGKSYELDGNWEEALKIYKTLQKEFPLSNVALSVPLYIAQYYQANGDPTKSHQAFDDAIAAYNQVVADHPNSEAEYKALRLLSVCYLAQKKWIETINVMEQLLLKYPAPRVANQSIAAINNIALTQLKDYNIPIRVYKNFIQNNPEHPLNNTLKTMIEAFEKLKSENVMINIAN